jgi:hypothetical protein
LGALRVVEKRGCEERPKTVQDVKKIEIANEMEIFDF